MIYQPPLGEIQHYLRHCTSALHGDGGAGVLDAESLAALLSEAGRFATQVVLPIDEQLDRVGARYADGTVTTAPGHRAAYRHFVDSGWMSVSLPAKWGGQGLPMSINTACLELWHSGSVAFAMGTLLNMGAVEAIDAYGSDQLKQAYLAKLTSGEWTASMAITEPDAGSDLSRIKTSARLDDDGAFLISGTKIFISYGEHDLADNIVHLVLARIVDAPAGVQGLSLFLVPKWLSDDAGAPIANDLACLGIERKLGQHGSPTCVMKFGEASGARGWLVGEANKGLLAMFTMMNRARLAVATQGVAIAERAFQMSVSHASQRSQGRNQAGKQAVIAEHVDVQRMLGTMMSLTSAARAIALTAADAIDQSRTGSTPELRNQAAREADFLTPLAKAFCTDVGCKLASMAIQVHGGNGFIEDMGVARLWRDIRIAPIYEGTNGIQAMDFSGRKLSADRGETARRLLSSYEADARAAQDIPETARAAALLVAACERARMATNHMILHSGTPQALAGATEFLELFALTMGAGLLAKAFLAAREQEAMRNHFSVCFRIFAERSLSATNALSETVLYGAETTVEVGACFADYMRGSIWAARLSPRNQDWA